MSVLGIMQPYFLPYIGYFGLIQQVDRFIILDEVQFIRHGWVDRNRILKQNEGWLYIRPAVVKASHTSTIRDVAIDDSQPWRKRLESQLNVYRKAPRFWPVRKLLADLLAEEHATLSELNVSLLRGICRHIGITTPIDVFDRNALPIDEPTAPDEWALNICRAIGNVREYWNPPGGEAFFDREKYRQAGIELKFHHPVLEPYDQGRTPFEPGLSIMDVLMFNEPERIRSMLGNFRLA